MSLTYMLKLKTESWEQTYNHHLDKLCLQAHPINKTLKAHSLPTLDEFSDLSEAGIDDYLRELLEDDLEEFGITSTKSKTNWHELNKALAYFTRLRETIRNEEIPDRDLILQEINFILESLNSSRATHMALMLMP
ncbi:MAG: hypothetical protein R3C11_20190 [Planctomycetaceae bacterium]